MKKQFFEIEKDGFYGTYYENPNGADCAFIGLFGDDPNDFMAKCGAKWLHKNGVNALCISPGKKNYSHVNNPLERIETAIAWLKSYGNRKIGIMGMSTAGMDSLVAASYFPDITLTFGLRQVTLYGRDLNRVTKTDVRNGRYRMHRLFRGEESLLLTCHLCMSILCTGRKSRRRQRAPATLSAVPVCLLIRKKSGNTQKRK